MNRRIVILTEGHTNPHTAKTACSIIRYRPAEVIGVLDSTQSGKTTGELLRVGDATPIRASISEFSEADTLLLGIAPPGGIMPPHWRTIILETIDRGMNVISGLHDFISDDPELAAAASRAGVTLTDVRKNNEHTLAKHQGFNEDCLRILTVGNDCSLGKMVTAIEICNALKSAGHDAKFVATGQTGIMVEGDGIPIDCVVADFVSGAAEKLVLQNQHHEFMLIEGQGSLAHPAYSGVTLSLLHGSAPHAMILCYEAGRTQITGMEHLAIPPLPQVLDAFETMAALVRPAKVVGISMNSSKVDQRQAEIERTAMMDQFGLPVVDVLRHGPDALAEVLIAMKQESAA